VWSLDPISSQGRAISDLFWLTLWVSLAVFLLVAGVLTYVVMRFRGRGEAVEPEQVEGNRRLEIIWTATPALILAVLFVLAVRTLGTVAAAAPSAPLRVQVTGHQWWWEYEYPELGFRTANELHLPVGQPVVLEIASADVIHSFWVPAFGWKADATPGRVATMRLDVARAGRFDGTCTEYCGAQHAWMRVEVVVEPRDQFDAWAASQRAPAAEPTDEVARRGKALFLSQTCVSCHTVRGTEAGARVGPELTHLGSRTWLGAGVLVNSQDELRHWLGHTQEVKPGVLMPSYTGLPDPDLDALAAYLTALR
jgi:cytochrome c oxidase subunit 2